MHLLSDNKYHSFSVDDSISIDLHPYLVNCSDFDSKYYRSRKIFPYCRIDDVRNFLKRLRSKIDYYFPNENSESKKFTHSLPLNMEERPSDRIIMEYLCSTRNGSPKILNRLFLKVGSLVIEIGHLYPDKSSALRMLRNTVSSLLIVPAFIQTLKSPHSIHSADPYHSVLVSSMMTKYSKYSLKQLLRLLGTHVRTNALSMYLFTSHMKIEFSPVLGDLIASLILHESYYTDYGQRFVSRVLKDSKDVSHILSSDESHLLNVKNLLGVP